MSDDKKITAEMNIAEVVDNFPETREVFAELGLACVGCVASQFETLKQGLEVHDIDLNSALEKLNAAIKEDK